MRPFEYASPTSREEVVRLLAERDDAAILAGGTDLLSLMKDDVVSPSRLVSVKAVEELGAIDLGSAVARLGATVSLAELIEHDGIERDFPALLDAAKGIRSPQMLNLGTLGGELCQRPRCWYYRAGFGLLGQRDGDSMVLAGDNRYHAILGNEGPAYFVSPSSLAPPLIALGARLLIHGPRGSREVELARFYRTPASSDEREYALEKAEVIAAVLLPRGRVSHSATYEVRHRATLDWPLAAAAVALEMKGERVVSAQVVLGHVAPTPWPSPAAAAVLAGESVTPQVAAEAGAAAVHGARALSRNGYKVQLAQTAVKRAILRAVEREV